MVRLVVRKAGSGLDRVWIGSDRVSWWGLGQAVCTSDKLLLVLGPHFLFKVPTPARTDSPASPRTTRAMAPTEFLSFVAVLPSGSGLAASFPGRGEVCQGSNLFDRRRRRQRCP